jgi:hypothetical protein
MGIIEGAYHKRTFEDRLITVLQVAICAMILFCLAMFAVDAWIKEDIARGKKLQEHFESLATRGQLHYEPTERQLPTWGAEKKSHLVGTGHYSKKVQREGD